MGDRQGESRPWGTGRESLVHGGQQTLIRMACWPCVASAVSQKNAEVVKTICQRL
jgi:hypothetical protein